MLDEPYYEALKGGTSVEAGVTIADARLLIPFKARAFLNLSESKERGDDRIRSDSIRKHLRDVFRLAQLLRRDEEIGMSEPIKEDMRCFLRRAEADEKLNPKDFDVSLTRDEGVALLRSVYRLN